MKNTLLDLNNHLMASLEELGDENLEGEKLEAALRRAETKAKVGAQVIANGRLVLDAAKFQSDRVDAGQPLPKMLTVEKGTA